VAWETLVAAALEGLLVGEYLELVVREADQEEEACRAAVIKDTALVTGTRRLTIARLSMDLGSTLTSGLILQILALGGTMNEDGEGASVATMIVAGMGDIDRGVTSVMSLIGTSSDLRHMVPLNNWTFRRTISINRSVVSVSLRSSLFLNIRLCRRGFHSSLYHLSSRGQRSNQRRTLITWCNKTSSSTRCKLLGTRRKPLL
jgi:hypothetical protein